MALSADTPRSYELGDFNDLPVKASTTIYEGAMVGLSSGYARGLVAGDEFQGFAYRQADNSSGSDGDINVQVYHEGLISMPVTGVTGVADVGKAVYASDDGTLTLTEGSNSKVGVIHRYVSSTTCIVKFKAQSTSDAVTLTDSTTGTAGTTINDVTGSFDQTILNNNFASLTAQINNLKDALEKIS